MRFRLVILPFLFCFMFVSGEARAVGIWGAYDELTPDQQRVVQRGGQVTVTQDVSGAPWPKITIYQRIQSTPEEALAVFADYPLQPTYVPNMKEAKIAAQIDSVTTRVNYLVDVAGDVRYTTDNRVSTYDNGAAYRMDWTMVKGQSMKEMWGNARFEELGTGTLVVYHTFILPTSGMAGWFRKKAIETAQKAAASLMRQIETERTQNPALLERQVEDLRRALEGRNQGKRSRSCDDWHWNGWLFCISY